MRLLENKICIVTGAGKGIGKSIAEEFAKQGAIVYVNSRALNTQLENWCNQIAESNNTRVIPIYFDVTDYQSVKKEIMSIYSVEKRIDVLVNNAGSVSYEMIPMVEMNSFRNMLETNVLGTFYLLQLVSRFMTRQKAGSIINIASIVGDKGAKGQVSYAASKGAVIAMTKASSKELASFQIRVNAITPGMVATERFLSVLNEKFPQKTENIGMGRLAEPKEIAESCVYLASDLSTYVTGQVLGVDGGTIL
jgi:3-oxoacyl-[acyl-carrier protein] reductase